MKTKTLALLFAVLILLTACTSPPAEETIPEEPFAVDGNTMRVGNITFQIPEGFEIYEQTDGHIILISYEYFCTMGFNVFDVSDNDESGTKKVVDALREAYSGDDMAVTVGGRDFLGTIDVTLDENMEPKTTVATAFTDSWFAYLIQTNYLPGSNDTEAMSVTIKMLYDAEIAETTARFDFVQ